MIAPLTEPRERSVSTQTPLDAHVVLLTNFIPPHALPVYVELSRRVRKLTVLLSTPMERNRNWKPDFGPLDVKLQRTLTIERPWKHAAGFEDTLSIHIPWNGLSMLRSLRPDIVISAEMGFRSLLGACYAKLAPRTRLILYATLSEHTEQGRGWTRYLLRRWLTRRADTIAVNGPSGARYLKTLGANPQRLVHVPYTIVPGLFDRLPLTRLPRDAHKLLYVGQLIQRKGLLGFVESLARYASDHPQRLIELDVLGSGPLESALRSASRPDNLRLQLLGKCGYEQLPEFYAKAGILVFPTLADEWGMVVNEALTAGLPVLGSLYSQAVDELCVEGQTGWRYRPDIAAETYQAIDRALTTSPDTLDEMRRAGRACVEHLTPAYVADGFVTAIHESLRKRTAT